MPRKARPKKVGRPKLAEDQAKAKIVPVRFAAKELQRMTAAAETSGKSLSEWIRSTLDAATQR